MRRCVGQWSGRHLSYTMRALVLAKKILNQRSIGLASPLQPRKSEDIHFNIEREQPSRTFF